MNVLFYDGTCKFCDRMVQLGLRHDRARRWRYSPLQSPFAARELARFGIDAATTNSIHALIEIESGPEASGPARGQAGLAGPHAGPGGAQAEPGRTTRRLLAASDAGVTFWRTLSGWPRIVGTLLALTPRFLREPVYRLIAGNRYKFFGRYDVCRMPQPNQADLFLWE